MRSTQSGSQHHTHCHLAVIGDGILLLANGILLLANGFLLLANGFLLLANGSLLRGTLPECRS